MRTLLAAAAAALAIAGGASSPAEAFRAGLREGRVGGPSTVPNHGAASGVRLNLARATADDNDGQEDARPARRWRSEHWNGHWDRRRYAKPRHVRSARRTARHDVATTRRALAARPVAAGGMTGMASYYGGGFHGRLTASGARFDTSGMTAAHPTLPFGTRVRVTHLGNGHSVEVRITDRGPFVGGRIIDLSQAAASVLGMQGQGVARVEVTVLGR